MINKYAVDYVHISRNGHNSNKRRFFNSYYTAFEFLKSCDFAILFEMDKNGFYQSQVTNMGGMLYVG